MKKQIKIKDFLDRYNNAIIYILLFLIILGRALDFSKTIENGDELWNFANVFKFYNGISLYRDNNVIITPLFFYLGKIFFNILDPNMLTFRIYDAFIVWILIIAIHRLMLNLGINKKRSILYLLGIYLISVIIIQAGANYNTLAIAFWITGINFLIENRKRNKKINPFLQASFTFLIFLTKQNVGIYYGIALNIYALYFYKKQWKKYSIFLVKQIISYVTMGLLFSALLIYNGELLNFLDYCFGGLGEFSNKNLSFMDLFSNYVYIALPIITVALIIIIGRSFGEKINILKNDNVKILCCFSFLNFLIAYPLFNLIHAKLGAMTSIVLLCYLIDNMIEYTTQSITETKSANIIKIGDNFLKIVKNIGVLVLLIISIQKLLFLKNELHNIHYEYMRNDPYYGAQFRKEEQEKYQEIQKWILEENKKGIDCVIFSTRANMYMLPLKQNHQDFDLPNLGNWGKNGEERVMNKIINLRNTNLLIEEKKGDMAAQESDRILKYIKENFTYKGKIADFLIYESKK